MFSINEADGWRQVDGRRLQRVDVAAALDAVAGRLWKVSNLREVGLGATDAVHRLAQDVQDSVN